MFNEQFPVAFDKVFPNATKSELQFIKDILKFERPKTIKEVALSNIAD
jgi:hypothetical protein